MTTENIQLIKLTAADGMVLTDGTSYGKEVYLCIRDTVNPVYNQLRELVGIYVQVS